MNRKIKKYKIQINRTLNNKIFKKEKNLQKNVKFTQKTEILEIFVKYKKIELQIIIPKKQHF